MDRWDVLAALGIILIGIGLAMVAPWLGVAVSGLLLLAVGVAGGILAGRVEAAAAAGKGR